MAIRARSWTVNSQAKEMPQEDVSHGEVRGGHFATWLFLYELKALPSLGLVSEDEHQGQPF